MKRVNEDENGVYVLVEAQKIYIDDKDKMKLFFFYVYINKIDWCYLYFKDETNTIPKVDGSYDFSRIEDLQFFNKHRLEYTIIQSNEIDENMFLAVTVR